MPGPEENLTDDVFVHAEQVPEQVGFSRRVDGRWVPVTYKKVAEQVTGLAAGLIDSGIQAGDRVALLSCTRFEWLLCDFAIWAAGGVTVPVYETSSAEQLQWILTDSGAVAALVETEDNATMVAQVTSDLPELRGVWVIDSGGIDKLVAAGRDVPVETVMQRRHGVTSDSLATIIYTSGTTGRPKGCAITHANLLAYVRNVCAAEGKGRIFDMADATAMAYSESLDTGGPGLLLRLRHALFDRLVYGKLRAALGGDVRWAVSGGAPLGARLGHFFRGIGLTVLEGYGLTETCAAMTLSLPAYQRIGSVGRPIPGCTVRIAGDGEVLCKGGNVFGGYWHNDEATREVFDEEGWFRSGDLGELDGDGYLTITGRKKDLLVTSSGKNVAPTVLEDRLRAHWLISQCVVVGDERPFIGALVTIDVDAFTPWKEQANKPATASVADLSEDPDLLAAVQSAVDDANKAVSAAEAIKRFRVLTLDFTVDGEELTPTLKVKRHVVLKEYGDEVEALYRR